MGWAMYDPKPGLSLPVMSWVIALGFSAFVWGCLIGLVVWLT